MKITAKAKAINIFIFLAALVLSIVATVEGAFVSDKETVEIGNISTKRYIATRSIENEIETERLRQEARESVGQLYTHNADVEKKALDDLGVFFDELNEYFVNKDEEIEEERRAAAEEAANAENEDGIAVENPDFTDEVAADTQTDAIEPSEPIEANYIDISDISLNIPVALTNSQYLSYYALSSNERNSLKDRVLMVAEYVFQQGITNETMDKAVDLTEKEIKALNLATDEEEMAINVLTTVLTPNLVLDTVAMDAAMVYKAEQVEPVMILKNQKIVDEGEIITEEIYFILDKLSLINAEDTVNRIPVYGACGLIVLVFIAVAVYFTTIKKKTLRNVREKLIIFTAYIISMSMLFFIKDMIGYWFIPLYLFPMLISIFIGAETAIVINLLMCIIATFVYNGGIGFLLYYSLTGTILSMLVQYTKKRSSIIVVALLSGVVAGTAYMLVEFLISGGYPKELFSEGLYAGATAIITVMLIIGSLPVWEAIFRIDTPYKLLDYLNPNNEILKRLMIEAPGTYHHSLIVANLAETAAYDIGANSTLARAGAYYHDIGKLHNPQCFVENQSGINIHDTMTPFESARLIIEHVTYGTKLAEKYRLPDAIKDFITQHHGTTLVKYFYFEAVKEDSDIGEELFRYPGPIPKNKENAIVMIADTVEAAVRSNISSGKSDSEIEELIEKLINAKLNDGQLNHCELNLLELTQIRKSFMKVFHGMYHERISYPDDDEFNKYRIR